MTLSRKELEAVMIRNLMAEGKTEFIARLEAKRAMDSAVKGGTFRQDGDELSASIPEASPSTSL